MQWCVMATPTLPFSACAGYVWCTGKAFQGLRRRHCAMPTSLHPGTTTHMLLLLTALLCMYEKGVLYSRDTTDDTTGRSTVQERLTPAQQNLEGNLPV